MAARRPGPRLEAPQPEAGDPDESEPAAEAEPAGSPRSATGSAIGKALLVATNGLVALSGKLFSRAKRRSSAAVADFQGRPEHVRWRAYALGSYCAIVALTLAAQLYTTNRLHAYVRIQHIDLPENTEIFVRNDSDKPWKAVRVQINGVYDFEKQELGPGEYIQTKVDRFAVRDRARNGKASYAPRNIRISQMTIDTEQGRYDVELEP